MKQQIFLLPRNSLAVAAGLAVLLLSACTKQLEPGSTSSEKLIENEKVMVYNFSQSIPIDIGEIIACANSGTGEYVHLTGFIQISGRITVNGNRYSVSYRINPKNVIGTGSTTGDKYQALGGIIENVAGFPVGDVRIITMVDNFMLVGPGPNNNFIVRQLMHGTISPDFQVTSFVDKLDFECK